MANFKFDDEPPGDFKLGEIDEAWFDMMYERLFKQYEYELDAIERARNPPPDLMKPVRESLDLVERILKVKCLMRRAYPKRSRFARRARRRNTVWPV